MRQVLAAALLSMLAVPPAHAGNLQGVWEPKEDLGGSAKYTLLCAMNASGANLSGHCVPVQDHVLRAAGRLEGNNFALHYSTDYNGSGVKQEYGGTVQPNGNISGTVENRLSSGEFTATPLFEGEGGTRNWKFDVGFPGLSFVVVCMLQLRNERLNGSCVVTAGATATIRGTVKGDTFAMTLNSRLDGRPVHADLTSHSVSDNTVTGAATADTLRGTFSLERP